MEKKFTKFHDGNWTRDLPHGSKSRASHSVQGPLSRRVTERLHTVCKAQCFHEWQRGFTQCARPSVSMSGREASHSLNTHVAVSLVCANLGGPTESGGSTRAVYCVPIILWHKLHGCHSHVSLALKLFIIRYVSPSGIWISPSSRRLKSCRQRSDFTPHESHAAREPRRTRATPHESHAAREPRRTRATPHESHAAAEEWKYAGMPLEITPWEGLPNHPALEGRTGHLRLSCEEKNVPFSRNKWFLKELLKKYEMFLKTEE